MDTSRLLASYNYNTNTPTAGRRRATLSATYLGGHLTFTSIIQLQYQHTTHPVGVGLHYQLPIWVDTSCLLASYNINTNTPTFGRRGATLSATYLGGHLTFTSIIQLQYQHTTHPVGVGLHYQLPIWVDTSRFQVVVTMTDFLENSVTIKHCNVSKFHGKECYEGYVISVTRGWVGIKFPEKTERNLS